MGRASRERSLFFSREATENVMRQVYEAACVQMEHVKKREGTAPLPVPYRT